MFQQIWLWRTKTEVTYTDSDETEWSEHGVVLIFERLECYHIKQLNWNKRLIVCSCTNPRVFEEREGVNVITNSKAIDSWMDKDIEAMPIILYNTEPLYQTSIEGSATSRKMWGRLQLEYQNILFANAT